MPLRRGACKCLNTFLSVRVGSLDVAALDKGTAVTIRRPGPSQTNDLAFLRLTLGVFVQFCQPQTLSVFLLGKQLPDRSSSPSSTEREPARLRSNECRAASVRPLAHQTPNTFITSSPRWLITLTAIRPVFGRGNGREVSERRLAHASSSISAFSEVFSAL